MTWDKAVVFARYSGFLLHLQPALESRLRKVTIIEILTPNLPLVSLVLPDRDLSIIVA